MSKSLRVAKRFCGPPFSANGGYFSGRVAAFSPGIVSVRLKSPPPLDTDFSVLDLPDGGVEVLHGDLVLAASTPATLELSVPEPVEYDEAVAATRSYIALEKGRFPTCFVCGVNRVAGDALRIFAGHMPGRNEVASPWVPDVSLDRGDGAVRSEYMASALDCPGYFAVTPDNRTMLLAQFTMQINRAARIGEKCTVMGWGLGSMGPKHNAGTAVFGEGGELCGFAKALWIEPRKPVPG